MRINTKKQRKTRIQVTETYYNLINSIQTVNCRIQEVKKITRKRYEQVSFMQNRLLNEFGEDWKAVPKIEIKEEIDMKPIIFQAKVKEEKDECM